MRMIIFALLLAISYAQTEENVKSPWLLFGDDANSSILEAFVLSFALAFASLVTYVGIKYFTSFFAPKSDIVDIKDPELGSATHEETTLTEVTQGSAPTPAPMNVPLPMEWENPVWHFNISPPAKRLNVPTWHFSISLTDPEGDETKIATKKFLDRFPVCKRLPRSGFSLNWTLRSKYDALFAIFNNTKITKLILTDMMHLELFPYENEMKTYICDNQEVRFYRKYNSNKMVMRHLVYKGDCTTWRVSMREMDMHSESSSFEVFRLKEISDGHHMIISKVSEKIYVKYSEDKGQYGASLEGKPELFFNGEKFEDFEGIIE